MMLDVLVPQVLGYNDQLKSLQSGQTLSPGMSLRAKLQDGL